MTSSPHLQTLRLADTDVCFGAGALATLGETLGAYPGSIAVFTGSSAHKAPWAAELAAQLRGYDHRLIEIPAGLLTDATVDAAVQQMPAATTAVLAIGGGRVLDAAKAAVFHRSQSESEAPPIVAVPTTAGTGSEITSFATVWDVANQRKGSVQAPFLAPRRAIVDPRLSYSCDTETTRSSALDALTQAIESAWSTRSTEQSRDWSYRALQRLAPALRVIERGAPDAAAWEALSEGSMLAGAAIAIANTTAAHAVSYPLTLRLGLPHGHAVALSICQFLAYNAEISPDDCLDERGAGHVLRVMDRLAELLEAPDRHAVAPRLRTTLSRLEIAPLSTLDIDLPYLAADALTYDRAHNNPRRLDQQRLERLLT